MGAIVTTLMFAAAAAGLNPDEPIATDTVDLIEINHFYDENGKLVFDQLLFYDWSAKDARFQVRAWRLLKKNSQLPRRDWQRGDYQTTWHDGDLLRHVRAKSIRETWTQYDPELIERANLAKDKRRELFTLKPASK